MAVYKRGYQRYEGPLTGRLARLLVLPRMAWADLLGQRAILILLIVALFFPVGCIAYVYLVNNPALLVGVGGAGDILAVDSRLFLLFMNVQSVFAILLAALAGPSLIAPDLANGALPLYFSRPFSRGEYIVARMLVLLGILSPITWVAGLILFGMQTALGGWTWFQGNWYLGTGMLAGLVLWILLVSLVAMASSAFVRWRVIASAAVLGVFFLTAGVAAMINQILLVEWGWLLNPAYTMEQLWTALLGADSLPGPSAFASAMSLVLVVALLIFVLWRKLRPVEVVR